jgi:nucleoside-diphosphate-sugar epimerase
MKALITGITGHLGRYLVNMLAQQSWQISGIGRSETMPPSWKVNETDCQEVIPVNYHQADICSNDSISVLSNLLDEETVLFHLAAWLPPSTAHTTSEDRQKLIATNVMGTMRVLEAARISKPRCVVIASTVEVYGDTESSLITEEHATYPLNDYGATKLSSEHHGLAYAYEEKVTVNCLRFPAIYGPGENVSRALPNFLKTVAKGERPTIHGDGEDTRDLIFGTDAAQACLLAAQAPQSGTYNINDGQPHSIRSMAEIAMRIAKLDGTPQFVQQEKPARKVHMDSSKAKEKLGFQPLVTLEQGMRWQWSWLKHQHKS